MDGFLKFLASKTGKAAMTVVLVIVIFAIFLWAIDLGTAATLIIAVICAVFGWKALNRITPNVFLWMSFAGWALYYFIKGFLSIFIGVFVAPFQLAKMISEKISESLNA